MRGLLSLELREITSRYSATVGHVAEGRRLSGFKHTQYILYILTYVFTYLFTCMLSVDTPEAPRSLELREVSRAEIVLQWDTPRHDGGSKVTGYVLERAQAYSNRWLRLAHLLSPAETSYRDVNVHDGCIFYFF